MFSRYFRSNKTGKSKKDKDITLVVEGTGDSEPYSVSVRRSVLAKYSAVFKKMAENGELKTSKEVKLKGITATGIQKIVEYARTDSVSFQDHSEAMETLKAAYLYQVQAMNDICCNFLITAIDAGNVCEVFEFVSSYSLFPLVEYHCLKFFDLFAEDVMASPAFLRLKRETVNDVIKRHTLKASSELAVFRAVLAWGMSDCLRRGVDVDNAQEVFRCVKPLLSHVRFMALSAEELTDPDVERFHRLMCSDDESTKNRRRSSKGGPEPTSSRSSRSSESLMSLPPREHVPDYVYSLEALECDEHAVKNGESFCIRIEVLKGRVFLTGVALAFERFVSTKNVSCLYAAVSATNVQTAEQKSARGTFMTSNEEAVLRFPAPIVAKESERVEMALQVKRAVNICSVVIRSDVHIVMPDRRDVAMKIIPSFCAGKTERSMFKSVLYFY